MNEYKFTLHNPKLNLNLNLNLDLNLNLTIPFFPFLCGHEKVFPHRVRPAYCAWCGMGFFVHPDQTWTRYFQSITYRRLPHVRCRGGAFTHFPDMAPQGKHQKLQVVFSVW